MSSSLSRGKELGMQDTLNCNDTYCGQNSCFLNVDNEKTNGMTIVIHSFNQFFLIHSTSTSNFSKNLASTSNAVSVTILKLLCSFQKKRGGWVLAKWFYLYLQNGR